MWERSELKSRFTEAQKSTRYAATNAQRMYRQHCSPLGHTEGQSPRLDQDKGNEEEEEQEEEEK